MHSQLDVTEMLSVK